MSQSTNVHYLSQEMRIWLRGGRSRTLPLLAERSEISVKTASDILECKAKHLTCKTIFKVAEQIGINPRPYILRIAETCTNKEDAKFYRQYLQSHEAVSAIHHSTQRSRIRQQLHLVVAALRNANQSQINQIYQILDIQQV